VREISQTSLEIDAERTTKMPFSGNCHSFDSSRLKEVSNVGTVYGLFKEDPTEVLIADIKGEEMGAAAGAGHGGMGGMY
jgi:hypothetical protein